MQGRNLTRGMKGIEETLGVTMVENKRWKQSWMPQVVIDVSLVVGYTRWEDTSYRPLERWRFHRTTPLGKNKLCREIDKKCVVEGPLMLSALDLLYEGEHWLRFDFHQKVRIASANNRSGGLVLGHLAVGHLRLYCWFFFFKRLNIFANAALVAVGAR